MRSKQVTTQIQLNVEIEGVEFEHSFLVVKGVKLDVILRMIFFEAT